MNICASRTLSFIPFSVRVERMVSRIPHYNHNPATANNMLSSLSFVTRRLAPTLTRGFATGPAIGGSISGELNRPELGSRHLTASRALSLINYGAHARVTSSPTTKFPDNMTISSLFRPPPREKTCICSEMSLVDPRMHIHASPRIW